jgi:REP element-mobilizing transposase RayT
MARPLRNWVAGGWYHVTARGNRQEAIFRAEVDRRRFLGLLASLPERLGVELHGFVLMDNHYHLVVRTLEPNLSDAMRWLRVEWNRIVQAAEALRGMSWREMTGRWGDWGRGGAIYVAVQHGRHRLSEVVPAVGGMTYGSGAQAVRPFHLEMKKNRFKAQFGEKLKHRLRSDQA